MPGRNARRGGKSLAGTSAHVASARARVDGRKGNGGPRPGSGRPRKQPRPLPWKAIAEAARDGATEDEIIRGLRLAIEALNDPEQLARFRDELAIGHAHYKLELRKSIRRRGQRTSETAGSVHALALQARNVLDWDSQIPAQETEPDLQTARQRLRDLVVRLAYSRSEVEGRPVTPLELLHREAQSDQEHP